MSFISAAQAAEAAGHAAHGGGFFSQAENWVAITFLIVVSLLARPVARGITAGLDLRRERIRVRIEDAERLRTEAQELLASSQKKQREAVREVEEIVARAKAEAAAIAAQATKDLDAMLKRREEQAIERLAQAEADALREVRNTAIDVAIKATQTVLAESITPAQASSLLDAAIKDLPNRLH